MSAQHTPVPTIWPHMPTFNVAVDLARVVRQKRAMAKAQRRGITVHNSTATECEKSARHAEALLRGQADAALYEVEHYGTFANELARRAAIAKATGSAA